MSAVKSFLNQSYLNRELIIVSDGCQKTIDLYNKWFKGHRIVKLVEIEKQPTFSGAVRQRGIEQATGDLIAFLDSDDIIESKHAENIVSCFDDNTDWIFFNAFYRLKEFGDSVAVFEASLEKGKINTACIAYKRFLPVSWEFNMDGTLNIGAQENWRLIESLIAKSDRYKKVGGASYFINHYSLTQQ